MTQKTELREVYRALRKQIPQTRREEASQALFLKLALNPAKRILSFASFGSELNLSHLNRIYASQERLVLAQVQQEHLELYLVKDLKRDTLESGFGPREPNPALCEKVDSNTIDLVIVPGLAFDAQGYRLGYGKGHYDRLLALMPTVRTIGVGFLEQKSKELLPRDSWDIPVHELLLV